MQGSCLRLELLGQTREECARGPASNEVQDGLVEQKAKRPEWWRVTTIEDDIVARHPEHASEHREQWSEHRRLPGDLDEDMIANNPRLPDVDVRCLSNRSRRTTVTDWKLEIGRNPPQVWTVRRSVGGSPEPGEVGECSDDPIKFDRAEPADEQRHGGEIVRGSAMSLH
jgi:hypothetical protein